MDRTESQPFILIITQMCHIMEENIWCYFHYIATLITFRIDFNLILIVYSIFFNSKCNECFL